MLKFIKGFIAGIKKFFNGMFSSFGGKKKAKIEEKK